MWNKNTITITMYATNTVSYLYITNIIIPNIICCPKLNTISCNRSEYHLMQHKLQEIYRFSQHYPFWLVFENSLDSSNQMKNDNQCIIAILMFHLWIGTLTTTNGNDKNCNKNKNKNNKSGKQAKMTKNKTINVTIGKTIKAAVNIGRKIAVMFEWRLQIKKLAIMLLKVLTIATLMAENIHKNLIGVGGGQSGGQYGQYQRQR